MKKIIKICSIAVVVGGIIIFGGLKVSDYVFNKAVDKLVDSTVNNITDIGDDIDNVNNVEQGNSNKKNVANSKVINNSSEEKLRKKANWKITSNKYKITINKKSVEKLKENVPVTKKAEVVAYVMSKFSMGEINEVKSLMGGTMTPEKKQRIKDIVYSKFSQSEVNKLVAEYNQYNK